MISRRPSGREPTVEERVDALDRAVALAGGRLDADVVASAADTVAKVRARMGHGSEHTVVAIAGPTGVGKSSLFNAIVGVEVSTPGVRRPTTDTTHAAVWADGDPAILDWLDVTRRHHVAPAPRSGDPGHAAPGSTDDHRAHWASGSLGPGADLAGLVLLDLPDFDSIDSDNRAEVARIVELVDLVVWVTDPQKYADELFHDGFVRPLAEHRDVMRFVVNRVDTVRADDARVIADDLSVRLGDDGIADPHVLLTSARTGVGLDAVHELLAVAVAERRAMTDRLTADVRSVASAMATGGETGELTKADRRPFVDRLTHAAGGDRIATVVAAEHRHRARRSMGWPPAKLATRWRRRHPIADLPRAGTSRVARSEIDVALRDVAEAAADGADAPWPSVLRSVATDGADDLVTGLDALGARTARDTAGEPRWWTAVQALQRALTAAVIVGLVWLLAVAALGGFLRFDVDPLLIATPGADWIPLPSLLVVGGLAIGLLVSLVVRIPVGAAARRRGASARRTLRSSVEELATRTVLADLDAVLADRRELRRHLDLARRET